MFKVLEIFFGSFLNIFVMATEYSVVLDLEIERKRRCFFSISPLIS